MKKKNSKNVTFETALEELEKIVANLEQGNTSLAESLEIFEQGMNLAALCSQHLDAAEKKIELLLSDNNGKISLKPAKITRDSGEIEDGF